MPARNQNPTAGWTGPKWTDYDCDPNAVGELTLSMVVSYTVFPKGMAQNQQIACMLSDNIPPMRVDGAIPLMKGPDTQGDQRRGKH